MSKKRQRISDLPSSSMIKRVAIQDPLRVAQELVELRKELREAIDVIRKQAKDCCFCVVDDPDFFEETCAAHAYLKKLETRME